jgi:hypothetical protein
MLRRVALVRTDIREELSASIIRLTIIAIYGNICYIYSYIIVI